MKLLPVLVLSLLILSCNKQDSNSSAAENKLNIAYGTDPKQKLDIYLPAGRNANDTKLLILIHGGGWTEGDKADFNSFIGELQKRFPSYAIANINYRLYNNGQNLFPTQENDTKAAIEWLISHSTEYKISKEFALLGASAGAHLALLQAYKYQSPVPIKAVISLFGPTELVSLYNNPPSPALPLLLMAVTGGTPASQLPIYQQSSPYNFISYQSPPTLLLQGGKDPLIPASQAVLLKDKLAANGVYHEYVLYPEEGHGWTGINLLDTFDKIERFLKEKF